MLAMIHLDGLRVIDHTKPRNHKISSQFTANGVRNSRGGPRTLDNAVQSRQHRPRKLKRRLRILEKRRDVAELRETKDLRCPVCSERNLYTLDALRVHLLLNHPALKIRFWELTESDNGVVSEVFIDHFARPRKPSPSQLDVDVLAAGEDRYLLPGRPWIKRRPAEPASAVNNDDKSGQPPRKKRKTDIETIQAHSRSTKSSPINDSTSWSDAVNAFVLAFPIENPVYEPSASAQQTTPLKKAAEDLHEKCSSLLASGATPNHATIDLLQGVEHAEQQAQTNPKLLEHAKRLRIQLNLRCDLNLWAIRHEKKMRTLFQFGKEPHALAKHRDAEDLKELIHILERFWPGATSETQPSASNSASASDSTADSEKGYSQVNRARRTSKQTPDRTSDSSNQKDIVARRLSRQTPNKTGDSTDDREDDGPEMEDTYFTRSLKRSKDKTHKADNRSLEPPRRVVAVPSSSARFTSITDRQGSNSSAGLFTGSGDKTASPNDRTAARRSRKVDEPSRSSSIENIDPRAPIAEQGMTLRSKQHSNYSRRSGLQTLNLGKQLAIRRHAEIRHKDEADVPDAASKPRPNQISPTAKSPISRPSLRPLPVRQKKKFKVPVAPEGVTFFTSATKRPLEAGEELSESDDDTDGAWLDLKQSQLIDQLSGAPPEAKEFMKAWNVHFRIEAVPGDRYFADAFLRFAAANAALLRRHDMQHEFQRKQAELRAEGLIRKAHITLSNEIIAASGIPLSYRKPRKQTDTPSWATRCSCGKDVLDYSDAVTCCNEDCANPDRHLRCVGLRSRPRSWLCPACKD